LAQHKAKVGKNKCSKTSFGLFLKNEPLKEQIFGQKTIGIQVGDDEVKDECMFLKI